MPILKADIDIKEVEAPPSRWCEGAKHNVPEDAVFEGKPTSFFRVAGKGVDMVVCAPCLKVAQFMAYHKRRMKDAELHG